MVECAPRDILETLPGKITGYNVVLIDLPGRDVLATATHQDMQELGRFIRAWPLPAGAIPGAQRQTQHRAGDAPLPGPRQALSHIIDCADLFHIGALGRH
ncbi:MAG: hypothetical protein BGO82_11170 [Devosia sp. 67-54]|nr:MAG: hypothetical protein BGO82_11170 [Devosia sp. 67-54]